VPRSQYALVTVGEGDRLEIVHFIGGGNALSTAPHDKPLTIAGRTWSSRLIVGTGKYKSYEENAAAVEAAGAEIVTVAVRRVNLSDPAAPRLVDFIDPGKFTYLPNTAGVLHRGRCRAHAEARARRRRLDAGEARSARRPQDALSRYDRDAARDGSF